MDKMKFAVGQVWETRDGEKRVITKLLEDGAEFPIYSETLQGDGQQVHTATGSMYKGGDDHGGDLVKFVGFALKDGEMPPPLKELLGALAASLGDRNVDEDENEGCDCYDRKFADALIMTLAKNNADHLSGDQLMTFVETIMARRKNLKF